MDFKAALQFVYSFKDWERGERYEFELTHFRKFLQKIDSPQSKIKNSILIAGTKGKGSTAHILSSIFQKAGKTGMFTSPHLVNICERIEVNQKPISEQNFVQILEEIKPLIIPELSTFELLTTLAFLYFAKERTDYSIFEVGLGGRLDATNVLNPKVSVLTPISFDHTEILGNTLKDIATEKCGIIEENGIVVSSPQDPEVLELIRETCKSKSVNLWVIGDDMFCEDVKCDSNGSTFKIGNEEYFLPLLGRHQVINALTAICTAQICGMPQEFIKKGLREVISHGRLEIVSKNPWIILDGAHNETSAWVLRRAVLELFDFRHLVLIFGVLRDKDKEGIIQTLAPITDCAIVTPLKSERSADLITIQQIFRKQNVETYITEDTGTALKLARQKAKPDDLILVTGSLYLVGELLSSGDL